MEHDALWFESAIARENAKARLKPQPVRVPASLPKTPALPQPLPQTETRGDAVYLSFPHLNLVLILDQQFYRNTLQALLRHLTAMLTVDSDRRVFVRYTRSGIEYALERLVVARTEDYWSVKLKRDPIQTPQGITADYRASNITIEKTAETRKHQQWSTEEAQRNHDNPNRVFQIAGKRVNQIHDADFISDGESRGEQLPDKPTRPKGFAPDDKEDWLNNRRIRGNAGIGGDETPLLSSVCYPDEQ